MLIRKRFFQLLEKLRESKMETTEKANSPWIKFVLEDRRKSGQIIRDDIVLPFYLFICMIISQSSPVLRVQNQVWNNRTEFSLPSKPVLLNISCKFMHCISLKV
jgi:hypothetical protein